MELIAQEERKLANHREEVTPDIIERVGKTPLLTLDRIGQEISPVRILAKAEWFNPGGSIKDRAALNIFHEARVKGELDNGKMLLDASSGNTALAYAMLGAALGYRVKLVLPENAGAWFRQTLYAYGAEVVFSDAQEGSDGAIRLARQIFASAPDNYFYADQYNNPANWLAHYNNTAVEIFEQTQGTVTHFVAGLGTSGTFMGTGRRLRELNERIELISVQPDSPFHGLEGLKHMESAIVPGFYDTQLADRNLSVSTERAQAMVKRLAREEGLLVGLSSGAALACALDIARELKNGVIVVVFPDSGQKYFDQRFWNEE